MRKVRFQIFHIYSFSPHLEVTFELENLAAGFVHICNFDICHEIQIQKDENKSELSRAISYS